MAIATDDADGWVGQRLANLALDFDPRTYGHAEPGDLVRETGAFEIDHPKDGGLRIRRKPTRRTTAKSGKSAKS